MSESRPPRAHLVTVRGLLVAFLALLAAAPASAHAAGAGLWDTVAKPTAGKARAVEPTRFRALTLDHAGLRELLDGDRTTISLPAPGGRFARFDVRPSAVMAPSLAAKHPEIVTYAGQGVDDPRTSVHLDLSPIGFHASVRGPGGTWYVDPYYQRDRSRYASYHGRALEGGGTFDERVIENPEPAARLSDAQLAGLPVALRTYRLALLTDPTYTRYWGGTSQAKAAKVALVNRVNQIYEDDLGITLQLIAGDFEFDTAAEMTGPEGPCGERPCFTQTEASRCDVDTLDRTMAVLGQLAGAEAFDVGHLALGTEIGGGVAYQGFVGRSLKAGGCTSLSTPKGDHYAVDYVAHELGHQFSGNHTFNGVSVNCSGANRTAVAAVEPGSGSSIMAYAGICGADNLQDHSDPYFSQRSRQEVATYVGTARTGDFEVQNVLLRDFDGTDSFRLTLGASTTAPIVRGTNYSATGIETAIQQATGLATIVEGVGGRVFDEGGFRVTFPNRVDRPRMALTSLTGGATGTVGTEVQGGPPANQGHTVTVTANTAPEVTAPPDRTIPVQTPFRLVGSATDDDGDPLTYSWEQNDAGSGPGIGLLTQPKANGPLFRQFSTAAVLADPLSSPAAGGNRTTTSPERVFPDRAQVAANATNADGTCPTGDVECFSEFLPTDAYAPSALNFRLTARDGRAPAGGVASDDVRLTLAKDAGPFLVTGPTTQPLSSGCPVTVTWAVAGTAAAPVSTANVEIRLSTDGGSTFPTLLEDSTANDGSATVALPAITTTRARLQVAAVGNYFFDVSDADLATRASAAPAVATDAPVGGARIEYTDAFEDPPTISACDSDTGTLTISAPGLPEGLSLQAQPADGRTRRWTLTGEADDDPGTYDVPVTVKDGAGNADTETLRIVVAPEKATAAYTGPDEVAAADDATTATLRLTAKVAPETPDPTPGDLTTATVAFRRGGQTLCTSPVAADGTAGCAATLPQGASAVTVAVGGRYTGSAQRVVTVTGGAPPAEPAPDPTVTPAAEPPPEPPGDPIAAAALALLEPDLFDVVRRPRVSRTGRFTVPVACVMSTSGTEPERCAGVVVVTAKVAGKRRTIARKRFDVGAGRIARVRLRLSKPARRALRERRLRARLSVAVLNADAATASAQKALVLGRR